MSQQIPRYPRPPALPLTFLEETPSAVHEIALAEEPVAARLAEFSAAIGTLGREIPIAQGATSIPSRELFETLSHRDDVPGAMGVREVKFLVAGVDTESPTVFFLNTNNFKYHYKFAREVLRVRLTLDEFNSVTYFKETRRFLAGTLIAHDSFEWPDESTGLYAQEFWPTDRVNVQFAATAFSLINDKMSFARNQLAYHPSGAGQEERFEAERKEFERRGVRSVSTDQIFSNITYSPLNLGVGFGKCRVIDGSSPQPPSIRDVVIFKSLPNDLTHVGGVISEEPQTPLSHINLKAKQNDTPNAYLRDAATDPRVAPLIEKIVRFEVSPDDIHIREATREEMEKFLEAQRPDHPQFPPRDLTRTKIVALDDIGHADLMGFGAKAANVAELRQILDDQMVPAGYAVPLYFYDRFMTHNGLYDELREIMSDEDFQQDPETRERRLKVFRATIRGADVPTDLHDALGEMHARFPAGTTPRCRSSTNNEDLVGFNGAGLYDSYTHREDEGNITKSIKQVWASLWNYRAYEERDFYRIDHFTTAMAVLVHPNFDDERANGVALTKNIYFPGFAGFYINVQLGEALVTNPDKNSVPEELLVMEDVETSTPDERFYETVIIRRSNLVKPGARVLAEEQVLYLTRQMEIIQSHFKEVYQQQSENTFAMDLEFKIDKDSQLVIKQARPWVD